jgi:hypothetical protein
MSVERFAFTQLIKGVRDGWEVPDDVLKAGIATAHAITKSSAASPRDKARAAELLISAAFRQKDHLVAVAKIEHDIIAVEAQNDAVAIVEAAMAGVLSPPAKDA